MNNIQMIFGAPGCGKTTELISILEELLKTYAPNEIAFVSFTKKGSFEGRTRAIEKFNFREQDFPFFRTIHSIAFRALGMSRYNMIDKKQYKEFSKALGMNFLGYYTEDLINNDDKYLFYCSLKKNNKAMAKEVEWDIDYNTFKMVAKNYERYKEEKGVKDFDDLIIDFLKEGKSVPVKVAIIDEAQDLTTLQWAFCELAFRDCEKVFIAGDDDQAIYEWSGADVNYFLNLAKVNNKKVLDQSYRLKSNILDFSKKVSYKISSRVDKSFKPIMKGGNIIECNSVQEVPVNNENSFYFLARNNYFLKESKSYLMGLGVTFKHKDKQLASEKTFSLIRKYEILRKNEPSAIHKDIVLLNFLKKDFKVEMPWYDAFDMPIEEINYYRDIVKNKTDLTKCNITLSTIHGVKGGEADNVVLSLDVTKRVGQNFSSSPSLLDAELRCLYVALTRAKKNLYIVHANSKYSYNEILKNN